MSGARQGPSRPGRLKRIALGGLLLVVGLPLGIAAVTVGWIAVLDRSSGSIMSSGERREYLLHVPASYDGTDPAPLVISLHAGATWPAHQRNLSRWSRLADEEGFLVVYPAGSDLPGLPGASALGAKLWHTFQPGAGLERDVAFIADLIDTLSARYHIDPARIYANGMSNGGGMAFVLSCALPDRIAAVGLVAATQSLPADWCGEDRPMPMIAFHGSADPIARYDGGPLGDPLNPVKPTLPAVEDWVASWARRNRCGEPLPETLLAADVARLEYPHCADDARVVLYTIEGGGHSWPGGKPPPEWRVGPTSNGIDATREMWEFFVQHRGGAGATAGPEPSRSAP